ncbi:glutathione S-transferase family protein [Herbaspirillum frisingense]|nr:glutathione S-transferase family protein [Herbaspirillum frisingense]
MREKFTLISHPLCPFVQRVAIVLHEKNIAFERVTIDLQNKPDWFISISPAGKVPLLKVCDTEGAESVLFESIAICEYLEDLEPQPALHPRDAISRAQNRAWIEFSSGALADTWRLLNPADHEIAISSATALRKKLEQLEDVASGGPYFSGNFFSMVDAAVAPIFRYFDITEVERAYPVFSGLQRITKWRNALAQRPSVLGAVSSDYADRFRKHLENQTAVWLEPG